MKKIVNIFLFLVFLIIVAGCIMPSFLPKKIEIITTKEFNNPISEVFAEFNDLENYASWGLLINEDSVNTRINYFAPYKGTGSSLTWNNAKDHSIGKGEYKILKSKVNNTIKSQIIFVENGVVCIEDIDFQSIGGVTDVTIHLTTENFTYFTRIFAYLYSHKLEESLNKSLDKLSILLQNGRSNKQLHEGDAEYIDFKGIQLLAIKNETSTNAEDVYKAMYKSLHEISNYLTDSLKYSYKDIDNPIVYYSTFDTLAKSTIFYTGYPVESNINPPNSAMSLITLPAGKAITTPINENVHTLFKTRYILDKYAKENGVKLKNSYWEEYQDILQSLDDDLKGKAFYLITE